MSVATDRVFERYKKRFVPLAIVSILATIYLGLPLLWLVAGGLGRIPFALLVLAYLYLALDRLVLVGNGWLRRQLAERLRALGERTGAVADRFVGLSYPCHLDTVERRMVESDDDVGFLSLTPSGLHYAGDAIDFDIPASAFEEVRLTRSLSAPWPRVELVIRGDEPFDSVIFDSRAKGRLSACIRDNRRLLQQLRAMAMAAAPATARMTAEDSEAVTIDAG